MIILTVLTISLLVALARGASLDALARVRIRYLWLFFVPFLLQLIVFSPLRRFLPLPAEIDRPVYLASMLLPVVALALNWRLPGVAWIAAGLTLNLLVITANGGFMPVSASARETAGMPALTGRNNNVIPMTAGTLLPWLGDVIPVPAWVPDSNVFSVGDIFIAIGGALFIQQVLVSPRRPAPGD